MALAVVGLLVQGRVPVVVKTQEDFLCQPAGSPLVLACYRVTNGELLQDESPLAEHQTQ